ncbi:MAG: glycerol-3-phosphate 1-O-acyltransferase PlsY [Alphaproteobacteria bacterium]
MSDLMNGDILICLVVGYLCGSIPFGLILTKMAGGGDIRTIGSGNIGATNVLRTGRKSLAAATLILDATKGAFSIFIVSLFLSKAVLADAYLGLVGVSAVIGHCYPVWLKFSGGKGVATGLAVITMLSPFSGILFIATWILVAYIMKYSSLAALAAFASSSISALILENNEISIAFIFITLLAFFRHTENIKRLLSGKESKISTSSGPKPKN